MVIRKISTASWYSNLPFIPEDYRIVQCDREHKCEKWSLYDQWFFQELITAMRKISIASKYSHIPLIPEDYRIVLCNREHKCEVWTLYDGWWNESLNCCKIQLCTNWDQYLSFRIYQRHCLFAAIFYIYKHLRLSPLLLFSVYIRLLLPLLLEEVVYWPFGSHGKTYENTRSSYKWHHKISTQLFCCTSCALYIPKIHQTVMPVAPLGFQCDNIRCHQWRQTRGCNHDDLMALVYVSIQSLTSNYWIP